MKLNSIQKSAIAYIESLGVSVVAVERGGSHVKVTVSLPAGKRITRPIPEKHTDHRGEKNFRSQIRKQIEGAL